MNFWGLWIVQTHFDTVQIYQSPISPSSTRTSDWLRYISQNVDTNIHCQSLQTIHDADAVPDNTGQMQSALDEIQSSRSMYVLIYVIASYNRNISSLFKAWLF